MALLTGSQSRRTGGVTLAAPSGGATSCGGAVGQFWLCLIVNFATAERVPGHSSETASTNQATRPGGSRFVVEVSPLFSMILKSPPSSDAKTRYASALAAALQASVTGAETFVAPSAGETVIGASPLQLLTPLLTVKVDLADDSGVHPSKNVSTYQIAEPLAMSAWSLVSVVVPTSTNGSLFDETQTR